MWISTVTVPTSAFGFEPSKNFKFLYAGMAELADALASGASDRKVVEVQVLLPAPLESPYLRAFFFCFDGIFSRHIIAPTSQGYVLRLPRKFAESAYFRCIFEYCRWRITHRPCATDKLKYSYYVMSRRSISPAAFPFIHHRDSHKPPQTRSNFRSSQTQCQGSYPRSDG